MASDDPSRKSSSPPEVSREGDGDRPQTTVVVASVLRPAWPHVRTPYCVPAGGVLPLDVDAAATSKFVKTAVPLTDAVRLLPRRLTAMRLLAVGSNPWREADHAEGGLGAVEDVVRRRGVPYLDHEAATCAGIDLERVA